MDRGDATVVPGVNKSARRRKRCEVKDFREKEEKSHEHRMAV
jgi:hypothetical protein